MNEKKESKFGNETPTARELPNAETGIAPCPFCGEAPAPSTDGGYVKCQNSACGIAGQVLTTNLWNKRAPLTATKEQSVRQAATEIVQYVCRFDTSQLDDALYKRVVEILGCLEGATRTPREQPNKETGSLPCPFCGCSLVGGYDKDHVHHADWSSSPEPCCILAGGDFPSRDWDRRVALISSLSQSQTLTEGAKKPGWVRATERPPTQKDANLQGGVLASDGVMSMVQKWQYVIEHNWPFWMKIPALPEVEKS